MTHITTSQTTAEPFSATSGSGSGEREEGTEETEGTEEMEEDFGPVDDEDYGGDCVSIVEGFI